jgi:UDPglucose 6-dehydrogenase
VRTTDSIGYDSEILKAVESVNFRQKNKLFQYISKHFKLNENPDAIKGKTFAIWGLSFKPNTDDMRAASSLVLMEALWAAGAKVQAFDPESMEETQRICGNRDDLVLMGTKEAALQGADALVICTEWQNFRAPDFDLIKEKLNTNAFFDGRNMFDPARMEKKGFDYYSIGRGLSVVGNEIGKTS